MSEKVLMRMKIYMYIMNKMGFIVRVLLEVTQQEAIRNSRIIPTLVSQIGLGMPRIVFACVIIVALYRTHNTQT